MTNTRFDSPYFAAIDLGSNSFHMLIVRLSDDKIEIVDRVKEMVQIAKGIQATGELDEQAIDRALSCLERFHERLKDIPQSQIRAVGTKTLRSITNSQIFIRDAQKALGSSIQIISGYEEARLVYHGLSNTIINEHDNRLVVDIGGGSTEFIIGRNYDPLLLESLSMGCVTYTRNFFMKKERPIATSMQRAYICACNELEDIRQLYLNQGWKIAYGTSGTIKAIAELVSETDGGALISRKSLAELAKTLIEQKELPKSDIPNLRKDVLPAGIAILQAIFDELELDILHVADATLKEGLIYDTIGRFSDYDIRLKTVSQLKQQYTIDIKQANRISKLAITFWKNISGPDLPGISRTKILKWASELHEIGLNISHSSFHHHGYYILRYSDLAGFSRYEQFLLANLVKFHRRKINKNSFKDFSDEALAGFLPLLVCLRLATCLKRRREDLDNDAVLTLNNEAYHLEFSDNYLTGHPLTVAGLEKESLYLEKLDVALTFA